MTHPLRYLAGLTSGRVILWCYAIWYVVNVANHFDARPRLWLTSIGLSAGHWMIWLCCMPIMIFAEFRGGAGSHIPEYIAKFQAGLTPPFVLAWFAYSQDELSRGMDRKDFMELMGFSLLGLFLYTMASLMMWFVMIGPRFRQLTRRNQSSSEHE